MEKHIRMIPSIRPTAILLCVFILVQIRGRSYVCGESLYVPNMPMNPDVFHFLHMRQGPQANPLNMQKVREDSGSTAEGENRDAVESYRKMGVNPDFGHPEMNGSGQKIEYGEIGGDTGGVQYQQDGGYGEQQQQRQQLPPMGFLFSKQFSQSSSPKIFNQPNGLLMDKEASSDMESEINGRLGLLTGFKDFNEFNLPSKHVVIRSRPSRFQVVGPPSTSKRNSAVGRDGYMCHFKLCQLGASGKRRWSPLFEND